MRFKQFLAEAPKSSRLAKLAKRLNLTVAELHVKTEPQVQAIIQNLGKHDFVPDSHFNAAQLKRGIEVEMEHTDSMLVAKLIAKDHLSEDPDYYTLLDKMEHENGI